MFDKKICVIGLGYIGLPTAALLANKGFSVVGMDIDNEVVTKVNQGKIHIIENDLSSYVKSAVSSGRLRAFNKIQISDIYIICVPTPFKINSEIPEPNIEYVIKATKNIAPYIKSGDFIILESTSPVGTTKKIKKILLECKVDLKDVHIAYCPERVLPGNTLYELVKNDRTVGGLSRISSKKIANFFKLFVEGKIIETDSKTAEMSKLVENSFRDLNVAFANEISLICDNLGINVWELIKIANNHPRVNILQPGTGVGGHCIAVDPWFLVSQDSKNARLIRTARQVNDDKTTWVINKIKRSIADFTTKTGIKPKVACLGLSFKPDIDDLRESKALEVYKTLKAEGYNVYAVEPNINVNLSIPLIKLSEAIENSDIICVLVKHKEFLEEEIKIQLMKHRSLDFCGAFQ